MVVINDKTLRQLHLLKNYYMHHNYFSFCRILSKHACPLLVLYWHMVMGLLFIPLRMYSQAATIRGPSSGLGIHSEGNEKHTHCLTC